MLSGSYTNFLRTEYGRTLVVHLLFLRTTNTAMDFRASMWFYSTSQTMA